MLEAEKVVRLVLNSEEVFARRSPVSRLCWSLFLEQQQVWSGAEGVVCWSLGSGPLAWQEAGRGLHMGVSLPEVSLSVQLCGSCLPSSLDFGHVVQLEVLPAFCSQAAH